MSTGHTCHRGLARLLSGSGRLMARPRAGQLQAWGTTPCPKQKHCTLAHAAHNGSSSSQVSVITTPLYYVNAGQSCLCKGWPVFQKPGLLSQNSRLLQRLTWAVPIPPFQQTHWPGSRQALAYPVPLLHMSRLPTWALAPACS